MTKLCWYVGIVALSGKAGSELSTKTLNMATMSFLLSHYFHGLCIFFFCQPWDGVINVYRELSEMFRLHFIYFGALKKKLFLWPEIVGVCVLILSLHSNRFGVFSTFSVWCCFFGWRGWRGKLGLVCSPLSSSSQQWWKLSRSCPCQPSARTERSGEVSIVCCNYWWK